MINILKFSNSNSEWFSRRKTTWTNNIINEYNTKTNCTFRYQF